MLIFPAYNLFVGLLVIWNLTFETANGNRIQGNLPDLSLISTFFNNFIKPYFKTWHLEPTFRAREEVEGPVEIAVKQKIKELKPFLQDNDMDEADTDNEITFQGNDETTIIEFVPRISNESKKISRHGNDTFKTNMRKYKKIRNKIYAAMDAESVSDKTKILVMRTLDELLSKMVETQCQWKGGVESTADVDGTDTRLIIPRAIVNTWRDEWHKFKATISNLAQLRAGNELNNFNDLLSYLSKLNTIINDFSDNLESFAKKYKITCNVSERKNAKRSKSTSQKQESFRLYDSDSEKNMCKNFKVCSKELKTFFVDFYNSLNDTSVNVLRSYAEMFTRDVNTDVSNEKNSIVDLILKVGDQTEEGIVKIFVNHTYEFKLDQNKAKDANVIIFSDYIKRVIQHIKDEVGNYMFLKLNHLNKRVYTNIYQDVEVNLGVDLGNLERDLIGKICLIFNVCNGNLRSRRLGGNVVENSNDNENKIYVKVEVSIDEDGHLIKANSSHNAGPKFNKINVPHSVFHSRLYKETTKPTKYENYVNISVTRTTLSLNTKEFINKTF